MSSSLTPDRETGAREPHGPSARVAGQVAAASTLGALDQRLSMRTSDDLALFAARWPGLATQTFVLVVDGDEPAERRWSPGEPVATLVAGPGTWGSLLSGEANIVAELTSPRFRSSVPR